MSITIPAPERITSADVKAAVTELGFDPETTVKIEFDAKNVTATIVTDGGAHVDVAYDVDKRHPATRSPLGKAAPRTRPGLVSIGEVDERNHPHWPLIDPAAKGAPGCTDQRETYQRTRCSNETCLRCWAGGHDNWPSQA